ncbi:MAG TPA: UDP-N-acetylmuramoyl-L-alanyl-D-glutamate--2,6-diaminopimelate ligase, partial [Gemmatimonadaceae bacterium]|nr:UDP-N-acetylmuramoyl-L-alanyl-D-glutamate--2,6-diaminopimelate ligase [Gemmatimonadaceae bacterium]
WCRSTGTAWHRRTPASRPMSSSISSALIVDALRREKLLVGVQGTLPASFTSITDDSRVATSGALFAAIRGSARDGHLFLPQVAAQGAAAAMVGDAAGVSLPVIVVSDTRRAVAVAAAAWYGEPARSLKLVGVTGTNGKTTSASMLRHLLSTGAHAAASIGTLGVLLGSEGRVLPGGGGLTTPGPIELQRVLRALCDDGVQWVAMEASSHALHQHRLDGLCFDVALFTNFTRDHLDYHGTMEEYFAAKAMLLAQLAPEGSVVTNADDAAWSALPAFTHRHLRFSAGAHVADVYARRTEFTTVGSSFTLHAPATDAVKVHLPLLGDFQVENAIGVAAVGVALGMPLADIAGKLSTMPQVSGRLERLSTAPAVLRDYAHTPDALERALQSVRPFAAGKVIVVFGAGGDRDRGKRPEMGRVAAQLADVCVVTSDNPRTEDPSRIIDDIVAGMPEDRVVREEDRREAIRRAIDLAGADDLVLLAGKGHETYQIRGTTSYPFDEAVIVAELTAR